MNEQEVNEAIAHVREIQTLVLDHQRFTGFSGVARMLGGVAALIIAWVLQTAVPPTIHNHLMGWGVLLLIGVVANFAGLACWVLNRHRRLDSADWWAVLEVFPALIVGGALSLALIQAEQYDFLFGTWMSLFGLAHLVYRRNLPLFFYYGGVAYVLAGVFCLLCPAISFTDPRPMGTVFGLGEFVEGMVLYRSSRSTGTHRRI